MDELNRSSLMATFFSLLSERSKVHGVLPLVRAGNEGLRLAADRLAAVGDTESALEMRALVNCIEESVEAIGLQLGGNEAAELLAERECLAVWQLIVHDDEPLLDTLRRLMALAAGDLEAARRPNNPRARLRAVP